MSPVQVTVDPIALAVIGAAGTLFSSLALFFLNQISATLKEVRAKLETTLVTAARLEERLENQDDQIIRLEKQVSDVVLRRVVSL